jgi:hypothetical protein
VSAFCLSALALRSSANFVFFASISALRLSDICEERSVVNQVEVTEVLQVTERVAESSMSLITPTSRRPKGSHKPSSRRNDNNKIYGNPLPILFAPTLEDGRMKSLLGLLGLCPRQIIHPHCEGFFDALTRSVWVSDAEDAMILWRRGFFGKGDLSRSEPSWLARQSNLRKNNGQKRSYRFRSVNPPFS